MLAAAIAGLAGLAVLLWHMRRPRPPLMAVSFVRFVPALPPAPPRAARLALVRPRDPVPLACLLAAAALAIWALSDADRDAAAARPDHIGLRVVLDVSQSMTVAAGQGTRFDLALGRLDAARAVLRAARADSLCVEILRVGAAVGGALAVAAPGAAPGALPDAAVAPPLAEGGDPARLAQAALAGQGECPLTHALILTDLAPVALPDSPWPVLWDQVGEPVGNAGIRSVALTQGAFGAGAAELRIEGVASGQPAPATIGIAGPAGAADAPVHPLPEAEGRWYALVSYGGAGTYDIRLREADGYAGDDRVQARIAAPPQVAVDWRLDALARPDALAAGSDGDLLVAPLGALADAGGTRPALLVHDGFGAAPQPARIGAFLDDPALLGAVNLDALERAMPRPIPGGLPAGFRTVLADEAGNPVIARRAATAGQGAALIVPAPAPGLPEPQRSLSLTLFFSALADLAALPARQQDVEWLAPDGRAVPEAWRESLTGRPAGRPADLALIGAAAPAADRVPVWPWYLLAALAAVLAERAIRAARALRGAGVVP